MAKKWYWCARGTRTVKSEKKCEKLSEIQGFTDKQKYFCSLGLTKKPIMLFCDTLIYQSRLKC